MNISEKKMRVKKIENFNCDLSRCETFVVATAALVVE